MGARYPRVAPGHAGAQRGDSARQDLAVFCACPVRLHALRAVRKVPISCAAARFDVGAARWIDALRANCARHRTADFLLGQEPAGRQPTHDARHILARVHAVGISVRFAQYAAAGAHDHLCPPGALLCGAVTERVSRGGRLVGDYPEHPGARGNGGRVGARQPRSFAQDARMNSVINSLPRILALKRQELLAVLKDPRSRMSLLVPPVVQALIFGYAATYDLNHVTYAALDQDHSAASRQLLAGLDGSGVFERVADLHRASDLASYIDARRALLVVQIAPDFERRLLAGAGADVQVIADGDWKSTRVNSSHLV